MEDNNNYNDFCTPILPLRDIVVFPRVIVTLYVGREKSLNAIDYAVNHNNNKIILVTQKDVVIEDPELNELYNIGVVANIIQIIKLTDGTIKVLVESEARVKITDYKYYNNNILCKYNIIEDKLNAADIEIQALARAIKDDFEYYAKHSKIISPDLRVIIESTDNPLKLSDIVAHHLPVPVKEKQKLLETRSIKKRMEKILLFFETEIDIINTEQKIKSNIKKQMEKTHKDYYLNEQLKAIQNELNEGDESKNEIKKLEAKIKKVKLSKEAKEKLDGEIKKLKMMNALSAEASVIRNYIDLVLSLPWKQYTSHEINLQKAQEILDNDHYGLEKIKERIIESLAVQKRTSSSKSPIICLIGPPGVGKTSLAKSIAEATGRSFVRISLGGIRDEAEIRGHRRTYIGAMPGKIINAIKKAKSSNPVILLDEIDKIGMDFRGDPTSALLEVLDPEQNSTFVDHYLEVEYDLSKVLFIATANSMNMPRPLLDRMEIIRLSGYTEEEKTEIAIRHLIPKVLSEHGMKAEELSITKEAIIEIIRSYTKEAGLRGLEKEIAKIARKALKDILTNEKQSVIITKDNLTEYCGVKKFLQDELITTDRIGITNGLAYTEAGGELLYIESVKIPGKGNVKVTGKLGEVMQESAQAAVSFVKSKAQAFGILPSKYQKNDIHIHVPEGATPKDGPSAGIALCTTIVSLLTDNPVKHDIAMTGEITLSGRVLAIGGLKEKLLAALRSGIKTVLIPEENKKDLLEIPDNVKQNLNIITVKDAESVLHYALTKPISPIPDDHPDILALYKPELHKSAECKSPNNPEDYITH